MFAPPIFNTDRTPPTAAWLMAVNERDTYVCADRYASPDQVPATEAHAFASETNRFHRSMP
jgi:hypothetical protein